MQEDDIVYLMCRCYIWPTYYWSTLARAKDEQGGCGRCGGQTIALSEMIKTKEEALEIFFENYGHYPEPITSNSN